MDREVDPGPAEARAGHQDAGILPRRPEDILGGDEKKQIEALTDYIMTLGLQPATAAKAEAAPAAQSSEQPLLRGRVTRAKLKRETGL